MLSWEYPPHLVGGLGKHVADLGPALAAQGADVHIVTPRERGGAAQETIDGVTIHRVNPPTTEPSSGDIISMSRRYDSVLTAKGRELHADLGGFDLIHGHDWLIANSGIALKYTLRIPLIVTVHSMERGRMQGHLDSEQSVAINGTEWWLTHEAWRVITVSNYMARQLRDHFSVPHDKLDVIYNGVMLPRTVPLSAHEYAELRATFAQPSEKIVYYVGRIVHEKGVQVLVEAAPQILQSMPGTRFVIAGTGTYRDTLCRLAQERGVSDHVIFPGFISDDVRDKLYQIADVAVFPSLYEPFGIVALEAMAYGCPIVVSATGGLAEFVKPHETGILVQPGDAGSLAWGILHTLQSPEWSARRAANARHEVEQLYNWRTIAAQTLATYRATQAAWRESAWGRTSH